MPLGPILGKLVGEVPPERFCSSAASLGSVNPLWPWPPPAGFPNWAPWSTCAGGSPEPVKARAARLGVSSENIVFLPEILVGRIVRAAAGALALVVDSLPTITTRASLLPGGPSAQREATLEIVHFSRKSGCLSLIVTQLSKKGLAGPRMVEHFVDVVLLLSTAANGTRVLKVTKNRLGPLPPPLLLRMTEAGLEGVDPKREDFNYRVILEAMRGCNLSPSSALTGASPRRKASMSSASSFRKVAKFPSPG